MLKVAVYHNLPSGGAKRALQSLARELAARGHQLTEICLSTADMDFCSLRPFVVSQHVAPFQRTSPSPHLRGFGSYAAASAALKTLNRLSLLHTKLAAEIDAQSYDVVFANDCIIALKPPLLRYLKSPSVFYCHHSRRGKDYAFSALTSEETQSSLTKQTLAFWSRLPWLAYWDYFSVLERRSMRAANCVLTNSDFSRLEFVRDYGVPAQVVPYGIDCDAFRPTGSPRGGYLLAVGELSYRKGYRFLVRSLARIPLAYRPRLLILANVVEDLEWKHVQKLAEQENVQLELQSVTDQRALADYYTGAELLVYAPIKEAFGLVAIEAMACGTPVVAVGEGGPCESVLDGVTGILTERDEQAFADATAALLASPRRRDAMGQAGVQHVRSKFTWQSAGEKVERYLLAEATRKGYGGRH